MIAALVNTGSVGPGHRLSRSGHFIAHFEVYSLSWLRASMAQRSLREQWAHGQRAWQEERKEGEGEGRECSRVPYLPRIQQFGFRDIS